MGLPYNDGMFRIIVLACLVIAVLGSQTTPVDVEREREALERMLASQAEFHSTLEREAQRITQAATAELADPLRWGCMPRFWNRMCCR